MQHFENIANENKKANERTVRNWVERHTPDEIRRANNSRKQLNRIATNPVRDNSGRKLVGRKVRMIGDSRAVKRPETAYIQFFKERRATGEFSGMSIPDAGRTIGREWRNLSASDAKVSF